MEAIAGGVCLTSLSAGAGQPQKGPEKATPALAKLYNALLHVMPSGWGAGNVRFPMFSRVDTLHVGDSLGRFTH